MGLPEGYTFRAPVDADADAIGELFAAERAHDPLAALLDAGFVREVWTREGFDRATDAWVVIDPAGAVVAYGQVRLEESDVAGSWGVVLPERRGLGIGGALLDRIEARAAEIGAPRFRHAINVGDPAAAALVRSRGLTPVHHVWQMQADLDGTIEPVQDPDGILLAPMDPSDGLRVVHAILTDAFADDWAEIPGPLDRWLLEEAASPSYDPSLWVLAWDGSTPVGVAAGGADGDAGAIDWFGVIRSHRGRGIGGSLLRRAFSFLAARGVTTVLVSVDAENETGATGVYERAGMRVVARWDLWERDGPPTEGSLGG